MITFGESSNLAFQRSLRCLQHPISWMSIGLLLVNDHLLKGLFPGVITGKLSDFAGLFFFPFLVALGLAMLTSRWKLNPRRLGGLAFLVTGLLFVLIKVFPPINLAAETWLSAVYGRPIAVAPDPGDLLALLALVPAWRLWLCPPEVNRKRTAALALGMASLACLATAPAMMDAGIYHFAVKPEDSSLVTWTCNGSYVSLDGGYTWAEQGEGWQAGEIERSEPEIPTQWDLADPNDSRVVYRFVPGQSISRSQDGGLAWEEEFRSTPLTEGQQDYYTSITFACITTLQQGPLNAVFDPKTQNLVIGMGHEGVLVRSPEGGYTWAAVDKYRQIGPHNPRLIAKATLRELLAALSLGCCLVLVIGLIINKRLGWLFLVIPVELVYLVYLIILQQNDSSISAEPLTAIVHLGGTAVLCAVFLGVGLRLLRESPRRAGRAVLAGGITAALNWLPYALWSVNVIDVYGGAWLLSWAGTLISFFIAWRLVRSAKTAQV
ncbi:MAG: hypothetical protein JW987_07170 [Anaerolineaceae bacterium]|nr:hypothetical protein [Anaerolineaceae bacterium]